MRDSGRGHVVETLLELELERATGVLEFSARELMTRIYVREGVVVFADAGSRTERIGEILVNVGLLSEEELVCVLQRMTDALVDNEVVRFGEVVVEFGFVTQEELEIVLTEQVRQKVIGAILRESGQWSFAEGAARLDDAGNYPVRLRPLIYDAMRRAGERRLEQVLELDQERYPALAVREDVSATFELREHEETAAMECTGMVSLLALVSKKWAFDFSALLAALVLGGAVKLRRSPTRAHAALEQPIPAEYARAPRHVQAVMPPPVVETTAHVEQVAGAVLEPAVEPAAPPVVESSAALPVLGSVAPAPLAVTAQTDDVPLASVAPAPLAAAAQTDDVPLASVAEVGAGVARHPSRRLSRQMAMVQPASNPESRERARLAFERLRDFRKKRDAQRPAQATSAMSDAERRLAAESAFHTGRVHLKHERAAAALTEFQRALKLQPGEAEYELYARWSKVRVDGATHDDAHWDRMRALSSTMALSDPDAGFAVYVLGYVALRCQREDLALQLFAHAFHVDASLMDAQRQARLLTMRGSRGGAGLVTAGRPNAESGKGDSLGEIAHRVLRKNRA